MFRSVRTRLILSYVAIVGLFLVLALGGSILLAQDLSRASTLGTLHEKSAIIDPLVQFEMNNASRPLAQSILARLRAGIRLSKVRVLLVDASTMTVEDDTEPARSLVGEQFHLTSGLTQDFYTTRGAEGTFADHGTRYLYVARLIRTASGLSTPSESTVGRGTTGGVSPAGQRTASYIVIVAQQAPALRSLAQSLFDFVGRAALIALLVSLGVAFFLARSISRPISRLAEAASAMARGDYSQRVVVQGQDETAMLSSRFNEMAQEVERAHNMQRDFVANVSHDLKTPLTSIQGFSQAMIDGSIMDAEGYRQAGAIINSEAERMSRLVTELLNLSRLQNGLNTIETQPTNLTELVKQLSLAMRPQAAQAGVDMRLDGADTALWVLADPDRLKQAFGNLIDNALKYTPPGGLVTVSLRQEPSWAEVTVADTGQGIPQDDIPRVAERFYQVNKSRSELDGRSVGLGLAIAREIIRAHHGEVVIESVQGKGTSVRVTFLVFPAPRSGPQKKSMLKRLNGSSQGPAAKAGG